MDILQLKYLFSPFKRTSDQEGLHQCILHNNNKKRRTSKLIKIILDRWQTSGITKAKKGTGNQPLIPFASDGWHK